MGTSLFRHVSIRIELGRMVIVRAKLIPLLGISLLILTLPWNFVPTPLRSVQHYENTVLASPQETLMNGNDLYCAGFISAEPVAYTLRVIGGERTDHSFYSSGDRIYISEGKNQSIEPGQFFQVVRPSSLTITNSEKKFLGYLNQEVGVVRTVSVKEKTAIAEVLFGCEGVKNGDLLTPARRRESPLTRSFRPLDVNYENPGKLIGQIVFANGRQQIVGERSIVDIDLGTRDGVNEGDYFLIVRRQENIRLSSYIAHRASGTAEVTSQTSDGRRVKESRSLPVVVAGELVVIHTEKFASTAMITRQTREVRVGDFVELR